MGDIHYELAYLFENFRTDPAQEDKFIEAYTKEGDREVDRSFLLRCQLFVNYYSLL